jgi:peroxiredoxin
MSADDSLAAMADSSPRFGIGDPVPPFSLPDTDGDAHAVPLTDAPPATVIVVTCNHCPYVIAWNPRLRAAAEAYAGRGVRFLGVHANDAGRYPADSFDHVRRLAREQHWPYPQLHDETQAVARALGAEVTPHVFVLDTEQRLAYRGAPDADHQDPSQDAAWLRGALDAVLAGRAVEQPETRARGCSVKWRGQPG